MRRGNYRGKRRVYCGRSRTAKVRYKTLADAKIARTKSGHKTGADLTIYRCPTCEGYHLTSDTTERDRRTAWKSPDGAVSSREEPDNPEENRDDRL
jgi:hypothetical protein